ncbi:MAG TPA: hypothetical protein VMZ03_05635 [Chitinophagaceae bacterium]|nr:hypothetical protein [Chitinophagaceae bacterium]
MKSNDPSIPYFSMKPVTSQEPSAKPVPQLSPYLKAILTAKVRETGRIVKMALSDKLAAIRYIQESNWRNELSRG